MLLVVAPDRERLVGVALGVGVEHVLELRAAPARPCGSTPDISGFGWRLVGDGQRALGDVLGEIADALEIGGDAAARP